MDEKHFKKHLADLAHGHHHPDEHDWGPEATGVAAAAKAAEPKKKAPVKKTTKKAKKKA